MCTVSGAIRGNWKNLATIRVFCYPPPHLDFSVFSFPIPGAQYPFGDLVGQLAKEEASRSAGHNRRGYLSPHVAATGPRGYEAWGHRSEREERAGHGLQQTKPSDLPLGGGRRRISNLSTPSSPSIPPDPTCTIRAKVRETGSENPVLRPGCVYARPTGKRIRGVVWAPVQGLESHQNEQRVAI